MTLRRDFLSGSTSAGPGNPRGSVTDMIAHTLSTNVLDHVDALCDMHSGGQGGRIHQRADLNEDATGAVREQSLELCRVSGMGVVHVNNLPPSTAVGYLNSRGKAAAGIEAGGTYMSGPMTDEFIARLVRGLRNQMKTLGILEGKPELPAGQHLFTLFTGIGFAFPGQGSGIKSCPVRYQFSVQGHPHPGFNLYKFINGHC